MNVASIPVGAPYAKRSTKRSTVLIFATMCRTRYIYCTGLRAQLIALAEAAPSDPTFHPAQSLNSSSSPFDRHSPHDSSFSSSFALSLFQAVRCQCFPTKRAISPESRVRRWSFLMRLLESLPPPRRRPYPSRTDVVQLLYPAVH